MTQTKILKFTNPFNTRCNTTCYTKVTIEVFSYDDSETEYYQIGYKHKFVDTDNKVIVNPPIVYPHPFADEDKTLAEFSNGNLIVKNKLTDQMIEFLMMTSNKLQKLIGNSCVEDYRKTIIHDIAKKWE
jgi:hypothetical protein